MEREQTVTSEDRPHKPYAVLMIAPTSFFSDYGCSVRILEEIRALQRLGHSVVVCTYRNGQDVAGLTIRRTANIPFRKQYEVGSSPLKIAFDFLLFWNVLWTALRRRPNMIHAHMHEGALIGLVVGRLLRIPVVFDFQGSLTGEMMDHRFLRRNSVFYRPLRWLEGVIDRRSSVILTSSHHARQLLISEFGAHPERVLTVSDCVDGAAFHPPDTDEQAELAERRDALGVPAGRRIVVYLGLLAEYQGTSALLQAAALVLQQREDVHFLVMGFPSVDYYQQMAARLGIGEHTTFTGKIPYHKAPDYLALGSVAVAPKLSATEGSGKILNYMATALPTVAFDTSVSREYLGEAGVYARTCDATGLAQAVLETLSDPRAQERGRLLRQMALRSYGWDQAAQIIVSTYDRVRRRHST